MSRFLDRALRGATCALICAVALLNAAVAATPPPKEPPLVLGINEGATDKLSGDELRKRYASLAATLSKVTGKQVVVEPYVNVKLFQPKFDSGAFDFVFGKSVHVVARGVVSGTYVPMVKTEKPYVAGLVVQRGSGIKGVKDLRGKRILLPPPDTYTSALFETWLNEQGIPYVVQNHSTGFSDPPANTIAVRYYDIQDNIATAVSIGLVTAGAVNPSVISRVEKGDKDSASKSKDLELLTEGPGVQVLTKLKPQTGWLLVANSKLPADVVQRASETLSTLHAQDDGKAILKDIRCDKLVRSTKEEYVGLIKYLYP